MKGKKTGGRVQGTKNKSSADIKALAQHYTPAAILALAALSGLVAKGEGKAESEAARVAALKELLDRGHGKAVQGIMATDEDGEATGVGFMLWVPAKA